MILRKISQLSQSKTTILNLDTTLITTMVVNDTVRSGDSFGVLLERNHLFYPQIHHIAEKTKAVFDVRQLRIGKPYTVLYSKDYTLELHLYLYMSSIRLNI